MVPAINAISKELLLVFGWPMIERFDADSFGNYRVAEVNGEKAQIPSLEVMGVLGQRTHKKQLRTWRFSVNTFFLFQFLNFWGQTAPVWVAKLAAWTRN